MPRFNMLTAVRFSHKDKHNQQHWVFSCECGKEKIIGKSKVITGHTKSCNCLKLKHDYYGTRTYGSWSCMKTRCLRKSHKFYKKYGGRGIKVCDRWLKFKNFLEDMGERPEGQTLDKIDNNGNYEPSNCR